MASLALKTNLKPQSLLMRPAARRSVRVAAACNTARTLHKVAAGAALSAALMLGAAAPTMAVDVPHQIIDLLTMKDKDERNWTFEISCGAQSKPIVNDALNQKREKQMDDPNLAGMFKPVDKTFLLVTCVEPTVTKTVKLANETVPVESSDLLLRGCPTWPCGWP